MGKKTKIASDGMKRTIKDAKLYKENDRYYLDLRVEDEDPHKVVEIHIPKIRFPIECAEIKYAPDPGCPIYLYNDVVPVLRLPYSDLVCEPGTAEFFSGQKGADNYYKSEVVTNVAMASKVIRENAVEMTMEELEKELGHKIKIVNNH